MVPSAFVRMAGHPLRWRLLAELADSDRRVRELTERVGEPQNLVSYHLRLLRDSGLVTARRSSFDGRDTYYHLDLDHCAQALTATGSTLHPALGLEPPALGAPPPVRVLFACTGNSARSPMAAALTRHRGGGQVEATSAGSQPKQHVDPNAVRVLRDDYGIDLDHTPRHLDTVADHRFDYVITLCDKVREVCPDFGDDPRLIHWSIPDPAGDLDTLTRLAAEIDTRVRHLLHVFAHKEVRP
ncbi:metalloregulator ArsR/SmtB family transcription factor [Actinokineospora sp. HUAS TT18]|uniref:metalloregulator ArsR/SmtB family transcription factor n=1 Tax=Actinokineospora sp. HUAS TT18 TaxID=3447451 RepID=UPI003F523174